MSDYHLFRADYRTDVSDDDPEYAGSFSDTIPESALRSQQIVGVDWSRRGWVTVTFLIPGPGHVF